MEVFNGFFLILFSTVLAYFCNTLEPEEVVDVLQNKALPLEGGRSISVEAGSTEQSSNPGKPLVKTKPSKVKLNWTKELEIEVTFANGTKEKIHLKAVADLKREKIPCLYTGSLDHDAEDSAVTVDGCQGDTQVLVEIASWKEVGGLLVLVIQGGQTYQLQPETTQRRKNNTVPKDLISTRRIQRSVSESNSTQRPLPKAVILKTMLVYDKSLLEDFGNDTQKVKNHLYTLAELVKPVLTLLDIKVKLRLFGNGVWGWDDRFYPSDSSFQKIRKKLKGKRIPIPLSFFTAQRANAGIAGGYGTACLQTTGANININWASRRRNNWDTVLTFAHELGHNLGMYHDFDDRHGGVGGSCDGKGIMSYGDHPKAWSSCSNSDFAKYYREGIWNRYRKGKWYRMIRVPGYKCLRDAGI